MLTRERRRPTWHYNEPRTLRRRLWWAFGYDPLTIRQRLAQVRAEAADWRRWEAVASAKADHLDAAAFVALEHLGEHVVASVTPEQQVQAARQTLAAALVNAGDLPARPLEVSR